ncbi:MAG: hypothetical protein JST21_04985 [Bacteroidetes bacterium]|nr:hypothetical protein [Bacteroidota bacterium]
MIIQSTLGNFNDPYSFFSGQNYALPPIISFHGKLDSTFNFKYQGVYFSPNNIGPFGINYHQEGRCLLNSYSAPLPIVNNNISIPNLITLGSETIYEMLTNNLEGIHIASELYLDCQMAHGLDCDYTDPNCSIPFQSDFGTGLTNDTAVYDYICARAATFFQSIIGGTASMLTNTKFVECANYRVTCDSAPNDNNCNKDYDPCPSIQLQ